MLIPVALICVGQSGLDFFVPFPFFITNQSQESKSQLTKNIAWVPRCAKKDVGAH